MAGVAIGLVAMAAFASFSVWRVLSGRVQPKDRSLPQMYARAQTGGGVALLAVCLIRGAPWGLTLLVALLLGFTAWRAYRLGQ
jgi:hypothetical protein